MTIDFKDMLLEEIQDKASTLTLDQLKLVRTQVRNLVNLTGRSQMCADIDKKLNENHRERAWIVIGGVLPCPHEYGRKFLETGDDPGNIYPNTLRFATAIARAEAIPNISDEESFYETRGIALIRTWMDNKPEGARRSVLHWRSPQVGGKMGWCIQVTHQVGDETPLITSGNGKFLDSAFEGALAWMSINYKID